MILSYLSTSQLLLATSTVTALVSTNLRSRANKSTSFSPRHVVSLAAKSYLDDASKNESSENGIEKNEADTSTTKSPSYDYLEDSSLQEPEKYLDDLASSSESRSSSSDDNEPSQLRSSDYLNDMAVEDSITSLDGNIDTKGRDETSEHILASLLRIAASTGRGEFASDEQKDIASELIATLETKNQCFEPTKDPKIYGCWELVYSSSQLFRSSPFFMAGRAVCTTKDQADQYDWFCDMHRKALAISNIGSVRQVISPTMMVSEFEVKVGALPFLNDLTPFSYAGGLPFTIDGSIVSSADINPTEDGTAFEIFMDTVEIKGSNVPGLRTILDNGLKLQSRGLGSFLENNVDGYTNPRPIFETTYLSDSIRISRDQDGKTFVYAKESEDSEPTNYENVEADLGALKLLGDLNDKITKFYI
mmetsp:Transcript_6425/g.7395  ORF Transcript_6425/g.7395 Transcript_6425/m.7395 type:complete len:419 (-) Transcript_6425:123-1379(-)|eukprot:CAMPEP_0170799552 /NCGR_PEP_ID=MMETSP0733-20121128/27148_1 /TAXON_ID=186038 /ORGANISM="Fragilariopsis kerguelensis, Strain L26-C5" /LENGTH=418 /DNA_ID=CAMNT_0011151375 /DNA_START=30 /DNA_END=1286 /DNA_ORIENTATION=+